MMKILISIFFYLSSISAAQPVAVGAVNWISPTRINTGYASREICEKENGGECFDAVQCPLDECEFKSTGGKTSLSRAPAKAAEKAVKKAAEEKRAADKLDRRVRIAEKCATADGLLKEICEELIDK